MTTLGEVRNVAVLGHKGAGKTALIEAALFLAKASPGLGRTGERAAGLDDSSEERAHLTTLEVRPAALQWNGSKVNLLDTPGEASFACDAKLALATCDAAVVCVSARDGVQTGTERALSWVREHHVPCLVMLTKMDDEHARPDEVVAEIKKHVESPLALMEVPEGVGRTFHGVIAVRTGKAWEKPEAPSSVAPVAIPPESRPRVEEARAHLVDDVAGTDDALTEKYLTDGDLSQRELDEGTRHAVCDRKLIPIYEGSNTLPNGIAALLDGIVDLLPGPGDRPAAHDDKSGETRESRADAPLSAVVFKTRIDPHAGKVSYVRVLSGTLRPDASLVVGATGQKERVGTITTAARDARPMSEAVAGDICAIPKLKAARTGDTLADEKRPFNATLPPLPPALYARSLLVQGKGAEDKAAQALHRLCDEDPGLVFKHDAQSREMLIEGLGALHLDITLERLRRRASIDCRLGPPHVAYRETVRGRAKAIEGKIKKQTGGHGQFGVCYIDLEPLPRGSGFVFEDAVVGGVVPRQFVPSVEKGARKALERGVLAGYPVVDVKVRLVDGKFHSVDSSDAAFQTAGSRAVRAALAAALPALLEPIAKLEVRVPADYLGEVIGDIHARGGRVTGNDTAGSVSVVEAIVPLANTHDYEPKLTSVTSGRGTFSLAFDHYDYCSPHTTDKIVKQSGFEPIEDED
jgi:elongation factor G